MARGRNWATKVFPGGIRNDICKVTMRTGAVNARYEDGHTNQTTEQRTLFARTSSEQSERRDQVNGVKDSDV